MCLLSRVVEEANPGEFVEVRHLVSPSPFVTFSEHLFIRVFCGLLFLFGILIFLGSGLVSLVKFLACLLFSLSGRFANIDEKLYFFVGGFLLITKFGHLFAVLIVLRLFFDSDHWLFFLLIRCDHDRLCVFLVFWFARRFVNASLATFGVIFLIWFFSRTLFVWADVHGAMVPGRWQYVLEEKYKMISGMVEDNLGRNYGVYVPFIYTIF